jgi:penicillin G amidase
VYAESRDDLFDAWAADEAFPLLYTRATVEGALGERIVREPG